MKGGGREGEERLRGGELGEGEEVSESGRGVKERGRGERRKGR